MTNPIVSAVPSAALIETSKPAVGTRSPNVQGLPCSATAMNFTPQASTVESTTMAAMGETSFKPQLQKLQISPPISPPPISPPISSKTAPQISAQTSPQILPEPPLFAPVDAESFEFAMQNGVEVEYADIDPLGLSGQRNTTDLVRLYLQEIGKVNLLERDEEISEAKRVQAYMKALEVRSAAADAGDQLLQHCVLLIQVRDSLTSRLGHRPSLERWAREAQIELSDLKPTLAAGKRRWAELLGLDQEALSQIQREGLRAKVHMIEANLRLVVSVAKKYQKRGLELLDLIQEGTIGLERAVEKFDPTRGYRFSTYAYWWIRQGITRAIATQSRTIRLPVHITEKLNKIKKAQRQFTQENGYMPSVGDIADRLDMTAEQVREVMLRVPRSVSLDAKVGKEKDTELGELLETSDASPEELLIRESLHCELNYLLSDLSEREQEVIRLRFGLDEQAPCSLAEIGRILELSRERVRQIEAKALQKLRQPKRRNRVRDFLEVLQ